MINSFTEWILYSIIITCLTCVFADVIQAQAQLRLFTLFAFLFMLFFFSISKKNHYNCQLGITVLIIAIADVLLCIIRMCLILKWKMKWRHFHFSVIFESFELECHFWSNNLSLLVELMQNWPESICASSLSVGVHRASILSTKQFVLKKIYSQNRKRENWKF